MSSVQCMYEVYKIFVEVVVFMTCHKPSCWIRSNVSEILDQVCLVKQVFFNDHSFNEDQFSGASPGPKSCDHGLSQFFGPLLFSRTFGIV